MGNAAAQGVQYAFLSGRGHGNQVCLVLPGGLDQLVDNRSLPVFLFPGAARYVREYGVGQLGGFTDIDQDLKVVFDNFTFTPAP